MIWIWKSLYELISSLFVFEGVEELWLDSDESLRSPRSGSKIMFSLSMLLISLQILQYFLCQSNDSDIGVTFRRHAVTLKNMEKFIEPHQ
jgi:hypothetical protein